MTCDWAKDSCDLYAFAHHMIRLRKGCAAETLWEMYHLEQIGRFQRLAPCTTCLYGKRIHIAAHASSVTGVSDLA